MRILREVSSSASAASPRISARRRCLPSAWKSGSRKVVRLRYRPSALLRIPSEVEPASDFSVSVLVGFSEAYPRRNRKQEKVLQRISKCVQRYGCGGNYGERYRDWDHSTPFVGEERFLVCSVGESHGSVERVEKDVHIVGLMESRGSRESVDEASSAAEGFN